MKMFNSYEAYENWTESFENCSDYEEIPVAIDDGRKVCMDMFTECKSWKVALRRFEKEFYKVNSEVSGWVEGMRESAENKYFNDKCEKFYSWGIEEVSEGCWYIFLNIYRA